MPPESFASLHSGRSWSRAWTCYSRGGFDEYSFSVAQMVKCLVAWQTVRLPNAERAQVERSKIVDYLLSPTHPIGRSKAKFFRRFGFRDDQWEVMATALRKHAVSHDVVEAVDFAFGRRYIIEGTVESPDGRNPGIRTVWMVPKGQMFPRLVTAHPTGHGE